MMFGDNDSIDKARMWHHTWERCGTKNVVKDNKKGKTKDNIKHELNFLRRGETLSWFVHPNPGLVSFILYSPIMLGVIVASACTIFFWESSCNIPCPRRGRFKDGW